MSDTPQGAGWFPDPTGRFARRYHDGTSWTDNVANEPGQNLIDQYTAPDPTPAPDQGPTGQQSGFRSWPLASRVVLGVCLVLVAVVIVAAVTRFSSPEDAASPDEGSSEADTTSTTTTVPAATPEQVASEIAGARLNWLDAYEQTSSDCFIIDEVCSTFAGTAGYLTLDLSTQTLGIVFGLEQLDGAVPAELEELVAETRDAIDAFQPAVTALTAGDCLYNLPASQACQDENTQVQFLADDLADSLDAWAPYV